MQTQKMKTQPGDALPEDIWKVVFQKLPVNTLLRLRGVCKSWRTIIDSPAFITEHFQHFNENSYKNRLILIERIGHLEWTDQVIRVVNFRLEEIAQITTIGKDCRVWETLNGLFLLQDNDYKPTLIPNLRLYNPYVNKSLDLPPCPLPVLPIDMFVLGFNSSTKDYKVIGFRVKSSKLDELSSEIKVYSCNDRCWKTKNVQMNDAVMYRDILLRDLHQPHFCQGAAHWLVRDVDDLFENTHVLSFDFGREEFRCVELPAESRRMKKFLFIFGKCLAVFCFTAERTDVWIMREDDGERVPQNRWQLSDTKNSSLDACTFNELKNFGIGARVTYDEQCGKLFALRLDFRESNLMSYSIKSQQMENCGRIVDNRIRYADTYVESLVNPLKKSKGD
ncbi:F-box protein At3g07870-like [Chenopodium quinoa]|uniref:F-box protein At3g07870-like n=1 Tax=Chenopodium quinoa TaxID=63459 RepID=UPI000B78DAEA|nr:F-box protein At3g07870-like [Chenopodium quinoa]